MGHHVAVAGASGYAGGELLRLISGHPDLELGPVTAGSSAGEPVTSSIRTCLRLADRTFEATDAERAGRGGPRLPRAAARRVRRASSPSCRGTYASSTSAPTSGWPTPTRGRATTAATHAGTWTYGLPELPAQRARIAASTRIANTGCYAVATTLALAPLLAAGLGEPDDVVVVAASGTTGAGRGLKAQPARQRGHGRDVDLQGRRAPARTRDQAGHRSAIAVVHARCSRRCRAGSWRRSRSSRSATSRRRRPGVPARGVRRRALRARAARGAAARVRRARTARISRSCKAMSTSTADGSSSTSAIDNLGKGAAGQAVQCANLVLGLDETAGLTERGVAP